MSVSFTDRDGRPLDLEAWTDLINRDDYRQVALDRVGTIVVSTIWLGVSTAPSRPLFETVAFDGEPPAPILIEWRYKSEA